MDLKRIAIFGAGNGGIASAGDLAMRGFEVSLYELPEFKTNIEAFNVSKRIELVEAITGYGEIRNVGVDFAEATKNADILLVVTPAVAHRKIAALLAPHVKEGQIVYLNPGSTFGALEFAKIFRDMGVKGKVPIVENSTLTYGARRLGPNKVRVFVQSKEVLEGVFPAKDTDQVFDALKSVYPMNIKAKNVMESSLNNLNPSIHAPATLLSAGKIERTGEFAIYREGVTPSVARVNEAMDNERVALLRAFGFREWSLNDQTIAHGYSKGGKTLYETLHSEQFESVQGKMTLDHRFLTEDVGYGTVSFASLGEQLKIPMPTCRAIIELTSTLLGEDYWKAEKRSMRYLGLDGMSKGALIDFLENGY